MGLNLGLENLGGKKKKNNEEQVLSLEEINQLEEEIREIEDLDESASNLESVKETVQKQGIDDTLISLVDNNGEFSEAIGVKLKKGNEDAVVEAIDNGVELCNEQIEELTASTEGNVLKGILSAITGFLTGTVVVVLSLSTIPFWATILLSAVVGFASGQILALISKVVFAKEMKDIGEVTDKDVEKGGLEKEDQLPPASDLKSHYKIIAKGLDQLMDDIDDKFDNFDIDTYISVAEDLGYKQGGTKFTGIKWPLEDKEKDGTLKDLGYTQKFINDIRQELIKRGEKLGNYEDKVKDLLKNTKQKLQDAKEEGEKKKEEISDEEWKKARAEALDKKEEAKKQAKIFKAAIKIIGDEHSYVNQTIISVLKTAK